jgi:hypothetical protein
MKKIMVSKKNQSLLINVGFMVSVIIGVINLLTFRELWILFAAVSAMVVLIILRMRENRKLRHKEAER